MSRPVRQVHSIRLDADGRIDQDISCLECDYNLRTLRYDGVCPECGTKVRDAILGDFLHYADAGWVRRLSLGSKIVWWWLAGTVLVFLILLCAIAIASLFGFDQEQQGTASPNSGMPSLPVSIGASLLLLAWLLTPFIGVWLLTAPEPQSPFSPADAWLRPALRYGFGSICVLAVVADVLLGRVVHVGEHDLEWVLTLLYCVNGILLMSYLAHLGKRLPDWSLGLLAALTVVGFVAEALLQLVSLLLSIGGVAAGARLNLYGTIPIVGGIVAFVSIGLLNRFAKELSGAAECAARFTWPPQEPKKTESQSTAEQ